MQIKLAKVKPDQKPILQQLLELYCYDFSEYLGTDVNEEGLFVYKYLDAYFEEPDRYAYFIILEGKYAGFVLINKIFKILQDPRGHAIGEFFILRKYRRKGIGIQVAHAMFDRYPGPWEVSQVMVNPGAVEFWNQAIKTYTDGRFTRKLLEQGEMKKQVLLFDNSLPS